MKRTSKFISIFVLVAFLAPATVQSAEESISEASEAQPPSLSSTENGMDFIRRGMENLKEENFEEAVEDFKKARELAPGSTVAAYLLGLTLKKIQDFERARTNLEDAVTMTHPVREAVIELADLYYLIGENEKALGMIATAEREFIKPAHTAFLKGLVLIKVGRYEEAIKSFETAKSIDPKLAVAADYQIGAAYLYLGRIAAARDAFKETVLRDPNSDLAQFSRHYIETIERRLWDERPLKFTAGLRVLYDDNVLLKPGDATVAGDVTNESDSATVATFLAEYSKPLNGGAGLTAQYSFYMVDYAELSSHDVTSNTLSISPTYGLENSTLGLAVSYNHSMVDDAVYLQTLTLQPTWSVRLVGNQFARTAIRYQRKEYMGSPINADEDRDSDDLGLHASWHLIFGEGRGIFSASYDFNLGDADGTNWRYYGNAFGADLSYPVRDNIRLHIGGEAEYQNFTRTHTIFGTKRKDTTYTVNTLISYELSKRAELLGQFTYIRGDSNIEVYDYDKYVASGGIEIKF